MSIIRKIPDNSRVRFPQARFSAAFAGAYDFNVPGNADVNILTLEKNSLYLIERFNFTASMDEGVWLKSQRTLADFPFFRLRTTLQQADNVYSLPVRCMHYQKNAEHLIYFKAHQESQNLEISFRGIVDQEPETVGEAEIFAFVSFTIYQIWDKSWISAYETGDRLPGLVA